MFQKRCFIAFLNHTTYPISLQHVTKTVGSLFKIKENSKVEIKKTEGINTTANFSTFTGSHLLTLL